MHLRCYLVIAWVHSEERPEVRRAQPACHMLKGALTGKISTAWLVWSNFFASLLVSSEGLNRGRLTQLEKDRRRANGVVRKWGRTDLTGF